jgi:hypothetical protein
MQAGELFVDRLFGAFAAIETMAQEELDSGLSEGSQLIYPVAVAAASVLVDSLEHGQRRMDRGMVGAGPVQSTVEPAVSQLLAQQEVDDADQLVFVAAA